MKRVYYLSTCNKCKRILAAEDKLSEFELIDIKYQRISSDILEFLARELGSYEVLFNKRAIKFKDESIRASIKNDTDYRRLILEEYTFLKRPIFINNEKIGLEKSLLII
jgi:arsenate reductase